MSDASPTLDVVTFGNAIVDVLATSEETTLERFGLDKGSMRLCTEEEAAAIYDAMGPAVEKSGGSAANTAVGVASLGGTAAFIGKVRDDQLGEVFAHDIRAAGVRFESAPAATGPPTGRCLVLITGDAQRTMNTFLGTAGLLSAADVDERLVASAAVTYVEGYLWEQPPTKEAIRLAADVAHRAGRKVAFSLSDSFCVDRNREEFRALVDSSVDILFGNEDEVRSLYEVDDVHEVIQGIGDHVELAAITLGAKGSILVAGDRVQHVDAAPVDDVMDTTGAGDLYAAGVLFGVARGFDLAEAGRLGSLAAAECIAHIGARPEVSLATLLAP
jgi:sugar/nucleoside kinase (ribokinase family)